MKNIERQPQEKESSDPILEELLELQQKVKEYRKTHPVNENSSGLAETITLFPYDVTAFIDDGDELLGTSDEEKREMQNRAVEFALGRISHENLLKFYDDYKAYKELRAEKKKPTYH